MDDCKRYLKQLYDSNKNLGLICSSSEFSNGSSIKNFWSDTQVTRRKLVTRPLTIHSTPFQQQRYDRRRNLLDLTEEFRKDKENESGQGECPEDKNLRNTDRTKDDYLELLNAIYPILRLVDERLLPSNMNIKFYSDMFAKRSPSSSLTRAWYDRKKYVETSQEALYQVIKKLESLHNVVRTYELDNVGARAPGREIERSNRFSSVCQNKFVSVTAENDGWSKNRKKESKERSSSISSEQYESDDTGRSSIVSVQNYTNTFNTYAYCSLIGNTEPRTFSSSKDHGLGMMRNDQAIYSTNVKYGKVPERAYYTISSDSSAEKNVTKRRVSGSLASSPVVNVDDDRTESFGVAERYPVPMETDEDVIVSPTSSRTEMSKDSELEDKPTAVLLQEALQFKKALLTRVELEKICFVEDEKGEATDRTTPDHGKCFYVNDDLRPHLDIISEEQSVSSWTEKTSRTCMFFNLKQDERLNGDTSNFTGQNDIRDSNGNAHKKHLDSVHNFDSASEYFSLSNIIRDGNEMDRDRFEENTPLISSLQVKYLNDAPNESDEKLVKNATDMNEQEIGFDYTQEKESFREHFTRMNSLNEFINRNVNSVELFSQDLDDARTEENIGNLDQDTGFNFFSSESLKRYANVTCTASLSNGNGDQELSPHSPNLTLKRNPGACSLIEQPLMRTNERPGMILTEDPTYELLASDSKGTWLETSLMQESLTSSINQSNDSNVPEPSSVTALIDKSLEEEKLNIDWLNDDNGFSDDCDDHRDIKTYSANTIVLQKCDARNVGSCKERDALRNGKSSSVTRDSFTEFNRGELIDEADLYKSYSNLVSAHSSMYFTDEGPASTTKLNDARPKALEERLRSNLYKEQNTLEIGDIGNPEALSTCTSNENKYIDESCEESKRSQKISTDKLDKLPPDEPTVSKEETKSLVARNHIGDHDLLPADVASDRRPFVSPRNEELNMERHVDLSEMKDERTNSTVKSSSHESCPWKLKRPSGLRNVKGLKSDLLNTVEAESEDSANTVHTKLRNLSAEPRRRTTDDNIKLDRKRSRSQVNFRIDEPSEDGNSKLQRSSLAANPNAEPKLTGQLKSLSPTPRTCSKSCIPILKSRLEAARKAENESRPKSPLRGPLTMTMFYTDSVCETNQDVSDEIQVEGNPVDKMRNVQRTSESGNHKQESTRASRIERDTSKTMDGVAPQEQMVIYVNIFTKYDHNATRIIDPNKFLEYMKNKKSSTEKLDGNQNGKKDVEFRNAFATSEENVTQKIVTVVSSVIDGNELDQTTTNVSESKTQNISSSNVLLNGKLKNLCFLSVEQREIDVTAKPSVMDTSTSISDLENVSGTARNKFQICGTPKELNNEEYIALLEILHQESNSVHLQELQNVCTKLSSARTKI
ncbi:uncharacterized protein LOC113464485 [Ceratina calcarata]|uniref:Uncharacterized protein LOC113464485 n=1 Tax=Ceratina calcarata TaxID=156304 RepID=A0AAJ7S2J9_9HYME|nr:uncharacterized protein LOC113464485 [Ceratina calcarata]